MIKTGFSSLRKSLKIIMANPACDTNIFIHMINNFIKNANIYYVKTLQKRICLPTYQCLNKHNSDETQLITKTYVYNFDPLKPHFYGYTLFFIFLLKNIDCVLVRTASARRF